jgi:hypothetical protein
MPSIAVDRLTHAAAPVVVGAGAHFISFAKKARPLLAHCGNPRLLAEDERSATDSATLLRIGIGEERAFGGDPLNVPGGAAHHAPVVGTDGLRADAIAPDNEYVRLRWRKCCAERLYSPLCSG